MENRKNRILYADFLTQQNDYTNGAAPAPPVLKSRYGLYNELTLGRLLTTPTEQVARLVVTIPPPPALSASSISPSATDTSITIKLPVSTSVTSYDYVIEDSSGNPLVPQPTATGDAAVTGEVTFSPLLPGKKYRITITATGPSGTSDSPPLDIYTLPTAPTGFIVTAPTTGGATVSWTGGNGATDYEYIVRDSTNNIVTGFTVLDNGNSGPATFSGLPAGARYTVTVIPRNPSGIPSSPPATFIINTAPAAPPAPTSSGSTTDGFSIPLPSTAGATGTPPYIYTVDGVPITTTSTPISYAVIGNDVVFSGVSPPGPRDVRVISVSDTGVESPGAVATLYTKPIAPLTNTFTVTSTSPSAFTLSWTGNTGATSYSYVIRANGVPIANPSIVNNGAAGNAIFSNLSPGVTYTVSVTVTNPAGSATSSFITAFTAPNAAAGITQTAGTGTTATIAWTDAAGATSYSYSVKDASQNVVGGATVATAASLLAATVSGLTEAKIYYIVVTSVGPNGSTPSTQATLYTAPSKPTGLYQAASTTTSITMAWYNGVGATSYVYTLGANTTVPSSDNGVTSQSAVFTGLTPGQTYTPITVTAQRVVSATLTLSIASDNYTTAGTSPAAPTFPASPISNLTTTGFTLTWDAGTGAGAYTHSLSLTSGGTSVLGAAPGPRIASSTANSVTFTGLTPGTQYYPSITAAISGVPGTSTSSPSAVTTIAAPAAPTVTNTPSNTITSRGVTIAFTPVAGMTYSYKVDGNAAAAITSLTPPATTPSYFLTPNPLVAGQPATVQFTGLSSGAAHTVSILSTDTGGTASSPYIFPSTGTFNTLAAPTAPTATAAATVTQTSVTLTLPTPPAGVTYSYSVSGPSGVLSPQPVPTISGNTYTFPGLTAGTFYTFAVTATDAAGSTSTYTSPSIKTASPAPVAPTATGTPVSAATSKGFTVNWNTVTGATSYNYSINTGGSTAQGAAVNTTSTSATFTGLTPGTTYTVEVKSVGPGGTSTTALTFTPKTLDAPSAITITSSAITATGFTVAWTGGTSSVAGNTITYSTVATPTTGTIVTLTGSSPVAFTGLTANTDYTITVTAKDSVLTSSTGTATAKTLSNLPAAPVISVESGLITTSGFTVKWPLITGATSYTCYINDSATKVDTTRIVSQPTINLYLPVSATITGLTNLVYSIYVKTNNGQESVASNTVTVVLLPKNVFTRISPSISLNTPSGNVPPSASGSVEITNFVLGESENIMYLNCTYYKELTGVKTTTRGSAIFSYDYSTKVFVKLAQLSSTGTSSAVTLNGLAYYNNMLYVCDNSGNILRFDLTTYTTVPNISSITPDIITYTYSGTGVLLGTVTTPGTITETITANLTYGIYATLPKKTTAINIDSSGNFYCVANNKIYKISIPTSPTPILLFSLTKTYYQYKSPYVSCDPSGNLYYIDCSISSPTNFVMKIPYNTNGTYGTETSYVPVYSVSMHSSSTTLYVAVGVGVLGKGGYIPKKYVSTTNTITNATNTTYISEVWFNSSETIHYYIDGQYLNAYRIP